MFVASAVVAGSFGASVAGMIAAGVGSAALGYSAHTANKARKDQRSANNAAAEVARKQASLADQANNRANAKRPDLAALFVGNAMPGGISSTMLTGAKGVDKSQLLLGRNTLLGG
jgi:predicted ATP-dependent serine protease